MWHSFPQYCCSLKPVGMFETHSIAVEHTFGRYPESYCERQCHIIKRNIFTTYIIFVNSFMRTDLRLVDWQRYVRTVITRISDWVQQVDCWHQYMTIQFQFSSVKFYISLHKFLASIPGLHLKNTRHQCMTTKFLELTSSSNVS